MKRIIRDKLEAQLCTLCVKGPECKPRDPTDDCEAFKVLLKLLAPLYEWELIKK